MARSIKRIGLLTGGGDCPGLNAVIRSVTKTAIFNHQLEVIGIADGFLGLIEGRMSQLQPKDVSNILTRGGTILGTSNKANPSHFATGKDDEGNLIFEDVTYRVLENYHKHKLDALVCIGGDGTLTGAADLTKHGLKCIGVPKTIDNDLMHCELTFGFQTASYIATAATDRIHTTAASHHRVMLVEMMGRNAGWLTLHSGIASGADVILIPEIPYDLDTICEYCIKRQNQGKSSTIIAVSEGAMPKGGKQVVDRVVKDSPDPIRLGGVSEVLCDQIAEKTHLECRATILGHVQRGGTPVPNDRILGTLYGYEALKLVVKEEFGQVVVMQNAKITNVPLMDVAGKQRMVPLDDQHIQAARAVGTSFGDKV